MPNYKNPVLIFGSTEAADHWMCGRIFTRAGLDIEQFDKIVLGNNDDMYKLNNGQWTVALLFGEDALGNALGVTDMMRWFYRAVPLKLNDRTIIAIPCFEPGRLLPYPPLDKFGIRQDAETRHPPRYQGMAMSALHKAIRIAKDGYTPPMDVEYTKDPTPLGFTQWVDTCIAEAPMFLSWDIETPYKLKEQDEQEYEEEKRKIEKTILRISFSYKVGHAVSIPFLPEYYADIQRLFDIDCFNVGWNIIGFDRPIVEANNMRIKAILLDGMDAWHLLHTDLDKGLEHVTAFCTDLLPWKHLSEAEPALYSCIDADAALRNILSILEDLDKTNLRGRFHTEMELSQILYEAGRRGNNVNEPFRLEFKAELEALMYTKVLEAQSLVAPKFIRKKLTVRIPKGADPSLYGTVEVQRKVSCCDKCGKERVSVKHKCPEGEGWQKTVKTISKDSFYLVDGLANISDLNGLLKYLKQAGFNPCSANQMKLYMKAHHHPVGTNHKTKKDTADVKHIKKLVAKFDKKHPIYAKALEIRLIQKALTTYVNGLEPDEHGLTYTTYVNSPSTWRLGSRNINVQNLGKRKDNPYATKARRIIIPREGHVFVQADSASIEALFVGHFMGDSAYKALARKGIHGYTTGRFLGKPWTAATYTVADNDWIKSNHKAEYDKFKQVGHGTNFGMGPYLMHMNDPITFPSIKDAERVQDFIFAELPGLPKWHHELRTFAKKTGYLDNPWGLRHYFYDVFNWKYDVDTHELKLDEFGRPVVSLGKDSKRVIAFKPQSSAGMFMRDNLILIANTELAPYMTPVVSIHDGYVLEVPDYAYWVDLAIRVLGDTLTRPIREMNNLRVGCEIGIMTRNFLDEKHVNTITIEE